jgi:hypothetical protein
MGETWVYLVARATPQKLPLIITLKIPPPFIGSLFEKLLSSLLGEKETYSSTARLMARML